MILVSLCASSVLFGCGTAVPSIGAATESEFAVAENCATLEACRLAFDAVAPDVHAHEWETQASLLRDYIGDEWGSWQAYADSSPSVYLVATTSPRETKDVVSFEQATALFAKDQRRLIYTVRKYQFGRDLESVKAAIEAEIRPGMPFEEFERELRQLGFEFKLIEKDAEVIMADHFAPSALDGLRFDRGVIAKLLVYPRGRGQCSLSISGLIGKDGTVLRVDTREAWLP